jgi:hypothetical protein
VVEWPLITGCNRWNPKAPAATFTITLGAGDGADSKGNAAVQRAVRPCTKAWRLSPVERPQTASSGTAGSGGVAYQLRLALNYCF